MAHAWCRLHGHHVLCGPVGELDSELGVDLRLERRVGLSEHAGDVSELEHEGTHVLRSEDRGARLGEGPLSRQALALDFSDPRCDDSRVGTVLERGPALREAPVAVGQLPARGLDPGLVGDGRARRGRELLTRLVEVLRVEDAGEPRVERGHHLILAEVHGARMVDLVRECVFGGVAVSVVRAVVGSLAAHAPSADPADEEPAQRVRVWRAARLADRGPVASGTHLLGDASEVLDTHESLVHHFGRPDPIGAVVPPQLRRVSECHVVYIDEHLVTALLVPHLATRVARIREDGAHGTLGSCNASAVSVARGVVRGRRRHTVASEARGGCDECNASTVVVADGRAAKVTVTHERDCPAILRRVERAEKTREFFDQHCVTTP